jgi:hypothetical protein
MNPLHDECSDRVVTGRSESAAQDSNEISVLFVGCQSELRCSQEFVFGVQYVELVKLCAAPSDFDFDRFVSDGPEKTAQISIQS